MILVMLGTQKNDFSRLLKEIENCIDDGTIKEEVIVQAGSTKYHTEKMQLFDLIGSEELDKKKEEAHFIITHGGVGSIVGSLKLGKKVIAVPRLKKYKEHVNDHQKQIVGNFDKKGYIKGVENISNLREAIQNIDSFIPKKFESNTQSVIKIVENYIDNN
ncbi:MAG: exopolysaccharide biosynthesis protein [Clostridia bacterium]|nr:exopolysaccharide biosynthesis protein [Clostridia bacterium]